MSQKPKDGTVADLTIANSVVNLIQGDIQEHLPMKHIPLAGDVLGLGTTTSIDNGELTFLQNRDNTSAIWRCIAHDGSIVRLSPGDGSSNFPYVCFTADATALRRPVQLSKLGAQEGRPLQELVEAAIKAGRQQGTLEDAPVYGVRLVAHWQELVITVASKLCMGQQRRNKGLVTSNANPATAERSIYDMLQHYRLSPLSQEDTNDPIRYLGRSMHWDCCGFFDTEPERGRVTVPQAGAHLHLHGCSTDLAYGGHLHHEHAISRLGALDSLVLYPLRTIQKLSSDLAIEQLRYDKGLIHFRAVNLGALDVNDVGISVVLDDSYSSHRYVRIPWMDAGGSEDFAMAWELTPGAHQIEVIADPEERVIEAARGRENNRLLLKLVVP